MNQRPIIALNVLYDGLPKTSGCEKCLEVNLDNVHWCCRSLSPSMRYVEFLNVNKEFQKWSHEDKLRIILNSIKNYLTNSIQKGCVFYNNGCTIYSQRPLECRSYGVIPNESWNERVKAAQEKFGQSYIPIPQCTMVKSDKPITKLDEDRWFSYVGKLESDIGISRREIELHDKEGGSYRTFHDNILLMSFDEKFLKKLTDIKLSLPTEKDIDLFLRSIHELLQGSVS